MEQLITRIFETINHWGKPVFGMVFCGSIGGAVVQATLPQIPNLPVTVAGATVGFLWGLLARSRGAWL